MVRCVVAEVFRGVLQGLAVFGMAAIREDRHHGDLLACLPWQRHPDSGGSCGLVTAIGVDLRRPARHATSVDFL